MEIHAPQFGIKSAVQPDASPDFVPEKKKPGKKKLSYTDSAIVLIDVANTSGNWAETLIFLSTSKFKLHPKIMDALQEAPEFVVAHVDELNARLPVFEPKAREPKVAPQSALESRPRHKGPPIGLIVDFDERLIKAIKEADGRRSAEEAITRAINARANGNLSPDVERVFEERLSLLKGFVRLQFLLDLNVQSKPSVQTSRKVPGVVLEERGDGRPAKKKPCKDPKREQNHAAVEKRSATINQHVADDLENTMLEPPGSDDGRPAKKKARRKEGASNDAKELSLSQMISTPQGEIHSSPFEKLRELKLLNEI